MDKELKDALDYVVLKVTEAGYYNVRYAVGKERVELNCAYDGKNYGAWIEVSDLPYWSETMYSRLKDGLTDFFPSQPKIKVKGTRPSLL